MAPMSSQKRGDGVGKTTGQWRVSILIAAHKCNRKKPKTQDGRKLRRYKRCCKMERLFAWLQNYRRILVRFDYKLCNYHGFVHLGAVYLRAFQKSKKQRTPISGRI
jgi:hypothetical protein